jgi:hypothetical protein
MKAASGSEGDLYSIAYRITRDHFDRVRLSTLAESAVQKITHRKWFIGGWQVQMPQL